MDQSLNDSLKKLNFLSSNTKKYGFLNILKYPSLLEQSKLNEAMIIAEDIHRILI